MSNEIDVLVVGSSIIDFICYVPKLPKTGETLHGTKFVTGFGGKGANQCIAAAKLSARTAMVTKVGSDSWGRDYLENFKREGVDISHVEIVKNEPTGVAQITVSDNGDNQIVIVAGANNLLSPQHVRNAKELFSRSKILICQLETPIDATIEALRLFTGISILNAAPALESTPLELLQLSTYFCVNETEAAQMTGVNEITNLQQAKCALRQILDQGGNTVIITLGKLGAIYGEKTDRKIVHVKSPKVETVLDTTGAGDAFIGSFAFFICRNSGLPIYKLIGAACHIAANSVQKLGTQSSFPRSFDFDIESMEFEWSFLK